MVVDRFEILTLDDKALDTLVGNQCSSDITHHIFHEFRIFVGLFGNVFFIGAFEQAVELAARLCFHIIDNFLDTDFGIGSQADGNVRTLIMRAILGNFFGTRAKRGYGNHNLHTVAVCTVFNFSRKADIIIQ